MAKSAEGGPDSKSRVLSAATDEFSKHGFAGARIERIARAARSNVRMIYYHFESKEGLYLAALRHGYDLAANLLDKIPPGAFTGKGVDTFRALFMFLNAQPKLIDLLVREILDGGDRLRLLFKDNDELFRRTHIKLESIFEEMIESGQFRQVATRDTLLLIGSMLIVLVSSRHTRDIFFPGETEDVEPRLREAMVDLLLGGLLPRS